MRIGNWFKPNLLDFVKFYRQSGSPILIEGRHIVCIEPDPNPANNGSIISLSNGLAVSVTEKIEDIVK